MCQLNLNVPEIMLKIRTLPSQLAIKAHAELHENTTDIEKHVTDLRFWVQQQRHLTARTG